MNKSWTAIPSCVCAFVVASALVSSNAAPPAQPAAISRSNEPRSWMMGFSHMPPRLTTEDAVRGIEQWSKHADVAILHEDVPWKELLGGEPAGKLVERKFGQLAALYRRKGLKLIFVTDLTDGLAREKEAPALRELKRSLADPVVQDAHRNYAVAAVRVLKPDFVALAIETNLIRELAPPAVYAAVVNSANAAAQAVRGAGYKGPLLTSVQVETAWGLLPKGAFRGIERDLRDFPFIDTLGLSTYPYFVFDDPGRIPADYYSRLVAARQLPVLVTESGWSSAATQLFRSSPETQVRYLLRQAELLESVRAAAWLQLLYADIDLAAYPANAPDSLKLFASIGLTDTRFRPKPAHAQWDALFARPLHR